MTMDVQAIQKEIAAQRLSHNDFDASSGNFLELLIFNNRFVILIISVLLTLVLGYSATRLTVNASYIDMLPQHQQYVVNYEANRKALRALGDSVRIVVENKTGNIYNPQYLATLRKINDKVFLLPGVDRSFMKSLWMPVVRWTQITEQGVVGGSVMPDDYDGSAASIAQLRQNIGLAGITGSLVSNDQRSSIIFVPLLDVDPATGAPFDYGKFWQEMKSQVLSMQSPSVGIHIVGFAAIMGNLIAALHEILGFFLIAACIASIFIFAFTHCVRSTVAILACSFIAVVWLLGIIRFLGYVLDPYSILVPFLVFAIGVSHGAQKMNGIMQDIGRGAHRYVAARLTFRRLFMAGLTALIADAVGFAVLNVIQIEAIRTLALTASIGVSLLVFTNLVLLPILLSYVGVSQKAAMRSLETKQASGDHSLFERVFHVLEHFSERGWAIGAIVVALMLMSAGYIVGQKVQIGDVAPGAPELRANSIYNHDDAFVIHHYSLSSDQFAIIVKGDSSGRGLVSYPAMMEMDRLEQYMRTIPGVQTTVSAADFVRTYTAASFSGNLKWWTINNQKDVLSESIDDVFSYNPELMSNDFSAAPLIVYLSDHKASTLTAVANAAQNFADKHNSGAVQFMLAAGNAGMDEATNIVVKQANTMMPYLVYAAVIILCFISFRNWRAVVVAVVPLVLTSVLCQALMVMLGIGVKVATLPVIALGVGIGVDYALYLLSVQLAFQRGGDSLRVAYRKALRFTGKIVALVGFTLATGVSLWAFSPIKFQADMGILLTFMFLWNMLGALILIPALSHFLLQTKWVAPSTRAVVLH
ncbi:RND transporter [Acidocella aquatica]|uniref:RND transporter n=1 Tax=Acidocella aquatica TaxID=1922313 RepID=A0ABQ6A8F6_9PROT|nr:MMPL family transporter [Acidocella aquatica]GLR66877.1 RND transporter [Acidocella aquatica]